MKKTAFTILLGVLVSNTICATNFNEETNKNQDPEVKLITADDTVEQFTVNKELTIKFVYGLNFAGKEKINKMVVQKFKELAGAKGFTHLRIDEDASFKKQHELRKRNYTVVLVGKAYKE